MLLQKDKNSGSKDTPKERYKRGSVFAFYDTLSNLTGNRIAKNDKDRNQKKDLPEENS